MIYEDEIEARICGIPCYIGVISGKQYAAFGYKYASADYSYSPQDSEHDFHLLDQRGRRAKWLEAKKGAMEQAQDFLDEYHDNFEREPERC